MTSDLLSRMAETLFWTGRYMERADDTARLVDVYVHRLLGDPGVQQAGSGADCGPLFGLLGVDPEETAPDVGTALFRLAYDTKSPSAIAGAVLAARAGARGIREVISSEMWECLNVAGHGLTGQRRAADRLGPHVFLRFIRERAALFFGLAESTMSHDDAWRFLVLGRSLERADMTARLLLARMPGAPEQSWPLLLRACGAYESFIRTHGGAAEPALVAEFLLRDRLFPRSVLHSLVTAEDCLAALNPGPVRMGMDDPARRPVGQQRTRLEYADTGQLTEQLPEVRMTPLTLPSQVTVETGTATAPEPPVLSWPELRAGAAPGRLLEFLLPTRLTTVTLDAAAAVLDAVRDADPARAAEEIAARVRSQVGYMAGATGVRTDAQEAWDQGQGVCQDIAHVTVALLRAAGLPARYVSGYLHADPSAEPGQTAIGESHAWVEYWAGSWRPLDPTSGAPVRERHVVVARGRDYADVSPLKGIYHGAPATASTVTVEVTRLA